MVRTEDLASETWTLDIVESGTVTASVRLRGQPQLDGRIYKVWKSIEMRDSVKRQAREGGPAARSSSK